MPISIIVAHDNNRLIGNLNDLPWKRNLPNDLKYFKENTRHTNVLMGKNTFLSIGRKLPERHNMILTHDKEFKLAGATIWHSIDDVVNFEKLGHYDIWVIGGASIYKQFLSIADYLYITEIDAEFDGDCYFPEYSLDDWTLTRITKGIVDENNKYHHKFKVYKRK